MLYSTGGILLVCLALGTHTNSANTNTNNTAAHLMQFLLRQTIMDLKLNSKAYKEHTSLIRESVRNRKQVDIREQHSSIPS